jgi:hypothetical protein
MKMLDPYDLLTIARQTRQAQIEQAWLEAEVRKARRDAKRPARPAQTLEPVIEEGACA